MIKARLVLGQDFPIFSAVKVNNRHFVANFVVLIVSNVVIMDVLLLIIANKRVLR